MLQSFESKTQPGTVAPRVAALRNAMAAEGVDAFLIPRADAHQGENVSPRDERLAWLTSFTGSAGFAAVTADRAALFIDGRYTLQSQSQTDTEVFELCSIPKASLGGWLSDALPDDATIAYDPWLHSPAQVKRLEDKGLSLRPVSNLVDAIWEDQPPAPNAEVKLHPTDLAGPSREEKRAQIAKSLKARGAQAAVLTLPDSIAWLLNIRGGDIARTPVALGFAIIRDTGAVALFGMEGKLTAEVCTALGNEVASYPSEDFLPTLETLTGKVCVDRGSAPMAVVAALKGAEIDWHEPVVLPKAYKSTAEIAGTRAAHVRDGAAFVQFLEWLDATAPTETLTEIAVVEKLQEFRRGTGALVDISFETICGAGPNGAIVHYRVTEESNRPVRLGDVLLVDSGGQYRDGTTDITRTMAVGEVSEQAKTAFTRVLKGMIAISMARWPEGLSGRDLDPLARIALWQAGQDYAHGTGHGVGSFLGVHEGPQRLSRVSEVPLKPGMILSNEPGYYREGAFGIRIENLVIVTPPETPPGGDAPMLGFETVTLAPIDRRMISLSLLSEAERDWLESYHARVLATLSPHIPGSTQEWLQRQCAPLTGEPVTQPS
ncbi:MAG: aminopeptidase P family protein [Pseudomonadota bacterium]